MFESIVSSFAFLVILHFANIELEAETENAFYRESSERGLAVRVVELSAKSFPLYCVYWVLYDRKIFFWVVSRFHVVYFAFGIALFVLFELCFVDA